MSNNNSYYEILGKMTEKEAKELGIKRLLIERPLMTYLELMFLLVITVLALIYKFLLTK